MTGSGSSAAGWSPGPIGEEPAPPGHEGEGRGTVQPTGPSASRKESLPGAPGETAPTAAGEVASVYVHAPFCARRCFYCDFAVTVSRSPDPAPWIDALRAETRALEVEGVFVLAPALRTVYVGGGTPSLLGGGGMEGLAGVLGTGRFADPGLEWTAEANPESFTLALAEEWRAAGVNRVSLGVQSFDRDVLRWMGRLHGPDGAREAVEAARTAGLDNVSVDLIFGLPGRLRRSWRSDLDTAVGLAVSHLSLYGLTAEEGTPLGRAVGAGEERMPDAEAYRAEYLEAVDRLTAAGYVHYEVSNFALAGMESRHNRVYWSGEPYLGLGNSAHSYRRPLRRWNSRDWAAYCTSVHGGVLPVEGSEVVQGEAERLEGIWLGLRTDDGLDAGGMPPPAVATVAGWVERGLATTESGRVRLTPEGWLLLDALAVELDRAWDPAAAGRAGARTTMKASAP